MKPIGAWDWVGTVAQRGRLLNLSLICQEFIHIRKRIVRKYTLSGQLVLYISLQINTRLRGNLLSVVGAQFRQTQGAFSQ